MLQNISSGSLYRLKWKFLKKLVDNKIHIMGQLKKKFSFDIHIPRKTNTFLNDSTYYN